MSRQNSDTRIISPTSSSRYSFFRILIIGRANAGKTTLLRRVCNAGDEAPIYRSFFRERLLKPTEGRGIHDINRSFHFPSSPQFVFHDSQGFETGDETQLRKVQEFIRRRAKARRPSRQLHVIWFCLVTNASRPILDLERKFFEEERPGNVPVVVIFTKFDDLITQTYDPELTFEENRRLAEELLQTRFKDPLSRYRFPPDAYLSLEDMHKSGSLREQQVNNLMRETADSLNDSAVKRLFMSLQGNNLELCLSFCASTFFRQHSQLQTHIAGAVGAIFPWFPHSAELYYGSSQIVWLLVATRLIFFKYYLHGSNGAKYLQPVYDLIKEEFPEPSLPSDKISLNTALALLICAENSFWLYSSEVSFIEAVRQSLRVYKVSESRRNIENALPETKFAMISKKGPRKEFLKLILDNRLPRPSTTTNINPRGVI